MRSDTADPGAGPPLPDPWPGVTYESRPWRSALPPEAVSRAARARQAGPYEAAVVAPIAHRRLVVSPAVSGLADDASTEIARFDAEVGHEVAPFGSILLRSESASSSQIERLTSGARAIAMAEIGHGDKRNAALIVANERAMRAAIGLADRLDEDAILQMQTALLEQHDPRATGSWRTEQVWIGGSGIGPHGAEFVPPHHDRVAAGMADLVAFVRRDDLPVLVQAAVAHAQFETIHPFLDGNGRTGRALIHAMLRAKGLTRNVTVPVSAGLLTDTDAYFATLTAYRRGDVESIVTRIAEATFAALHNGRALVRELREARAAWDDVVVARRDAVAWRLADLLVRQPVVDATFVQRELGATSANAQRALRRLAEAGVITEITGRRRDRLWQAPTVLRALDDFAQRAGRRTTA
ncbi:MAG: Fic family protein [Solirubrobacteraceae bacterium]